MSRVTYFVRTIAREDQEAGDPNENSALFEEYKSKLPPLVDGETVLFGNAALGYEA